MTKLLKIISTSLAVTACLVALNSWAGVTHSIQQTANTLNPGSFEGRVQTDFFLNRGGGVDASGHFRTGIIEDMLDIEGYIGTGKTDFKTGAAVKFNFLPDLPGQIGVAFIGGYSFIVDDYRSDKEDSINVLESAAIASKKLDTTFGTVSPYGGLQVEVLFKHNENEVPISGILGAEWAIANIKPWVLHSEIDVDINHSAFLLGLGGSYLF